MELCNFLAFRRAQFGSFYAGIGSRKTPPDVIALMTRIARKLDVLEWTLRSGGADGADEAFEEGVLSDRKEIYLPWRSFNGRVAYAKALHASPEAIQIASKHHPFWDRLTRSVQQLHARNVHQVLGPDCASPSALVLCWTPDGSVGKTTARTGGTGGTGEAIRIAHAYDVPVFNLKREDHCNEWERFANQD